MTQSINTLNCGGYEYNWRVSVSRIVELESENADLKARVLFLTNKLQEQWELARRYQKDALLLAHKTVRNEGLDEELRR